MAFKEGVAVHCACFQILFERVQNLHFSEILNENVQRISLTIIAFLKQFKIENKFLPHFKNMPFGLKNASKLSECVCVLSDELMTCPGCTLASRLVTAWIETITRHKTDEEQVTVNRNRMD